MLDAQVVNGEEEEEEYVPLPVATQPVSSLLDGDADVVPPAAPPISEVPFDPKHIDAFRSEAPAAGIDASEGGGMGEGGGGVEGAESETEEDSNVYTNIFPRKKLENGLTQAKLLWGWSLQQVNDKATAVNNDPRFQAAKQNASQMAAQGQARMVSLRDQASAAAAPALERASGYAGQVKEAAKPKLDAVSRAAVPVLARVGAGLSDFSRKASSAVNTRRHSRGGGGDGGDGSGGDGFDPNRDGDFEGGGDGVPDASSPVAGGVGGGGLEVEVEEEAAEEAASSAGGLMSPTQGDHFLGEDSFEPVSTNMTV